MSTPSRVGKLRLEVEHPAEPVALLVERDLVIVDDEHQWAVSG